MITGYVLIALGLVAVAVTGTLGETDQHQLDELPLPDGRIVGGEAADIREYPHQISMRYNGRHRCGGSIIAAQIVLSAAHCVIGVDANLLTIAAGSTTLSGRSHELTVSKYIMHSKYKSVTQDYDMAIIVLRGYFEFNEFIQPIPLATERPPVGSEVTVTGWGVLVEDGSIPDHLQQVHVNVVDNSVCRKSYSLLLTSRMLCAGVENGGKDACQGDSGGPLVFGNQLLGVVSWGIGCARPNYPGVYASVPDLLDWIEDTVLLSSFDFI